MILPRSIRKMLAVFRGSVAPPLIFLSVLLGFWFGLIPGWSGLHTLLVVVVLILNVHLGLFLLSAALGKALCFAAAPVLYHVGGFVQDYLAFVLQGLGAIPIVAVTDFDNYAVAGAALLGPVVGAVAGLLMAKSVISFRKMLLKFEEGSEKFKKWYSNTWVRILDRLLIGKRTKDAKSLFTGKTKYIRKVGVVLALLVVMAFVAVTTILKDQTIKSYAVNTMTKANGAEVNLDQLAISLLKGDVLASGIQVTDANNPKNNQVEVQKIEANASVYSLLLGKVIMDKVEVTGLRFDQPRQTPGKVVEAPQKEPEPFDPCDYKVSVEDIEKIQEYFKDAQGLKDWLAKVRKWLPKSKEKRKEQAPHKYLDYLTAKADVPPSVRMMAREILLDQVEVPSELFGNSKILIQNISDAMPSAKLPVTFAMDSHETGAAVNVTLDFSKKGDTPQVSGAFGGIDLGKLQSKLGGKAGLAFDSGMASGDFTGSLTSKAVDLTVKVSVQNLQAKAQGDGVLGIGAKQTDAALKALRSLEDVTLRIVGPITEPRIEFPTDKLRETFLAAAKQAIRGVAEEKLGEQTDRLMDKVGDKLPDETKDILKKGVLDRVGGILGGKKDEQDE